jgi:hypothetical protein
MSGVEPAYTLSLMGPFRLLRPDGTRIEVTSKRGVALIAMLASAHKHRAACGASSPICAGCSTTASPRC